MDTSELMAVLERYPELLAGLPDHVDELVRIAERIVATENEPVVVPASAGRCARLGEGLLGTQGGQDVTAVPAPAERLANPDALLSRTDLRELGLERRAVDAIFRALPVIVLPGYSRPLVRVSAYLELLKRSTFDGDRVR